MANEKRLIDAEQAKRATYEEIFWTESEQAVVRHFLAKIPKVDAVEVVRCKDCEHWKLIDSLNPHRECQIFYGLHDYGYLTGADDFCSYGERRTGE